MLVQAVEFRKVFGIPRPDLTDGIVHQPPSYRRSLFDQIQIVRAEKHGIDDLRELTCGFLHTVYAYLFGIARAQENIYGLAPVVACHVGQHLRGGIAKAHKLLVKPGSEAPAGG